MTMSLLQNRLIMKAPWLVYGVFGISLTILSFFAFHGKSPLVFYRFDGTYTLISAVMQKNWSGGDFNFSSNPLQGLGGMAVPWHTSLDPALWLAVNLPLPWGPSIAMTLYALFLALGIFWLAIRLGLATSYSMVAASIGVLLALPYKYPSLGFDFLWGVPSDCLLIALNVVVIVFFLDLGRSSRARDLAHTLGILCICIYQFLQQPNFAPVSLLPVAFLGIVAILGARTGHERIIKILAAVFIVGIILAIFGRLLYGLFGYSKPTFFWYEFYARPQALREHSFLIAPASKWPAWITYGLAIGGTLFAAIRGGDNLRLMARGLLVFILGTVGLIALIGNTWQGPRIAYIDIFLYPFYCVFAAYALSKLSQPRLPHPMSSRGVFLGRLAIICVISWIALGNRVPPLDRPLVRNHNPFIWPPSETPVTKFLAQRLALKPGALFRGRIASVAGSDFEREWVSTPFITQHNYDAMNLFFSGNDHRMYGLWYHDIPTLFESNQFSSPFFHLVNARLLNAPGSRDTRSYETQSVPNWRIMELLGVRYLLSDKLIRNSELVFQYKLTEGRNLFIYSLPNANLSGYSVTEVRQADSAKQAINMLADPSLDLHRAAVVSSSEILPNLVPASRSGLWVERGGYRIDAESAGTSLLVLPLEYSHCLQAQLTSTGQDLPRLVRANLTMAALLFSGHVRGTLQLRYGALSSDCRMDDWSEANELQIGGVKEWPAVLTQ